MTWNSWIVSIEIVRKCLFNTRFFSFYFHLHLLRSSKVLFARAQCGYIQPIAPAVTCFKARSQSSWVSFHWNVEKETYELWIRALLRALKNVTAGGTGCKLDRGSSVKVKHSFVRELSNTIEFEYVWPLFQISAVWGPWRFWAFDSDFVRPR